MKRGSTKVRSFRLLWLVMIGALVLSTASCEFFYRLFNQPPVAGFTVGPSTAGEAPFTVTVSAATSSDPDKNIESYAWNFGDGATGSGAAASHTYTAQGTYTIVLTVTDKYGETATATKVVYVTAEQTGPSASFTASPTSGASPLTVSFDASDSTYDEGTIQSYSWNFGDGQTGAGVIASHTYSTTTAKTYTVTLTVRGTDGETSTATKSISVTTSSGGGTSTSGAPSARFTIDDQTGVAPHRVNLDPSTSKAATGRTIASYAWSFGDDKASSSTTPDVVQHTYITSDSAETFSITLVVIDDVGKTGSIPKTVRVENYQPVAGFEIYSLLNVAAGGEWWTDNNDGTNDNFVTWSNVGAGAQTVRIRSQLATEDGWKGLDMDRDNPVPNAETSKPANYVSTPDGPEMCYDPEGQTWEAPGGKPAWFPNRAWGIQQLEIDWGDGSTDFVAFQDAADTVAQHEYTMGTTTATWTITVTAIDFLGARTSLSRTIRMLP